MEKSQYDLRNDTDIKKSIEVDSLSSKNKEGLNSNNELSMRVDGHQKSLSEKDEAIQQLTVQVDKLNESTEEYQKGLSEKEEIILQLKAQVVDKNEAAEEYQKRLSEVEEAVSERDEIINQLTSRIYNLNVFSEEYQKILSEKEETVNQLTTRLDSQNVITLEQLTDEEKETIPQVFTETDSSDVMVQVKSLYNENKYEKALKLNSNMKESRKTLGSLDDLQEKEGNDKEEGEAVDSGR